MMSSSYEVGTSRPPSEEEIERRKVETMRALVEARDPSAKELDDAAVRRFLRARNSDVEKGSAMLVKYLTWRREFVPNSGFSAGEVIGAKGECSNEVFLQGCDKLGRPILVCLAGHHKRISNVEQFKRFCVFTIDKICSRMPSGQEKFVLIMDMKGYGYANNDIRALIASLTLLQDSYPERLAKLFIVHASHFFMAVWKVVSPFLDKNTTNKIMFLENKKMRATMLQDIDESQLAEIYGGKLKLVPIEHS